MKTIAETVRMQIELLRDNYREAFKHWKNSWKAATVEPGIYIELAVSMGTLASTMGSKSLSKFPDWEPGDSITKITPEGKYPGWDTIRSRYWKNRVLAESNSFSPTNRAIMQKGNAPKARILARDRTTGNIYEKLVSKELHHARGNRGVPGFDTPIELREVWPWEHERLSPSGRNLDYDFIRFN